MSSPLFEGRYCVSDLYLEHSYAYYDQNKESVVLFYEQYQPPFFRSSKLVWIESLSGPQGGKWTWTEPTVALEPGGCQAQEKYCGCNLYVRVSPELPWELIGTQRVGNPFVFYHESSSKWRLHYSASSIHLNGQCLKILTVIASYIQCFKV